MPVMLGRRGGEGSAGGELGGVHRDLAGAGVDLVGRHVPPPHPERGLDGIEANRSIVPPAYVVPLKEQLFPAACAHTASAVPR